jgi:hypothetical protein
LVHQDLSAIGLAFDVDVDRPYGCWVRLAMSDNSKIEWTEATGKPMGMHENRWRVCIAMPKRFPADMLAIDDNERVALVHLVQAERFHHGLSDTFKQIEVNHEPIYDRV